MTTTMDPAHWARLKILLADSLALDVEERSEFVRRACAGDAAMQADLESLLAAAEPGETALDTPPAARIIDALADHSSRAWEGKMLGPYRLQSLIARGGMGEVYRGERADGQYEQQVAIKLMREGGDQVLLLARFDAERRILASLDHPNLSKLIDAGVTPDGVPYFVMELVDGVPIDAYCEAHQKSIEDRLRLFRSVCQVVEYAHRQGVIHRDLKPANILVTEQGVVKLVDFGIAKRVAGSTDGAPAPDDRTATAQRVLTPEYASPEQIRGEALTPASDIYALGVVLYRLLTHASPYGNAASDSYALTRAICETEPPRPSQALGGDGAPSRKLKRKLQGDLDAVVLKALRKEPARRYASAEAMSDDVFRHLEGLPVQARRGAWSYRAGRFVLRHRAAVGAALVANLALVAGIAIATYQAVEANRQRERAERHFASVRKLANSMILEMHDAIRVLPGSTPARKLLVQNGLTYLQQLSTEVHEDKALQLELATGYRNIADIQGRPNLANLGDPAGALTNYQRALALAQPLAAPERKRDPGYRAAQQELAVIAQRLGGLYGSTGKFKEAQAALNAGIPVADDLAAADPNHRLRQLLRATLYGQLSQVQMFAGDIDTYLKTSDLAAQQLEKIVAAAPDDRDAGLNLSTNYSTRGEYFIQRDRGDESAQLALDSFRKGLVVLERLVQKSPDNTALLRHVATQYDNIGWCLRRLRDTNGAVASERRAVEILKPLVAKDPSNAQFRADLAVAESGLGEALLVAGQVEESVSITTASVDDFAALPAGAREDSFVLMRQGVGFFDHGQALAARAALPGRAKDLARADMVAACDRYRQSLPILEDLDKRMGMEKGNLQPAEVRAAMQRCT